MQIGRCEQFIFPNRYNQSPSRPESVASIKMPNWLVRPVQDVSLGAIDWSRVRQAFQPE
jgi:hypothetical protein